jgi:hypothetical protein
MLRGVRQRARQLGIECDIRREDIVIPERCPVLGIPLAFVPGAVAASTPSVDRMDPTRGYVGGNVRVISYRANTLKNNATLEEMELIVADLRRLKENGC